KSINLHQFLYKLIITSKHSWGIISSNFTNEGFNVSKCSSFQMLDDKKNFIFSFFKCCWIGQKVNVKSRLEVFNSIIFVSTRKLIWHPSLVESRLSNVVHYSCILLVKLLL